MDAQFGVLPVDRPETQTRTDIAPDGVEPSSPAPKAGVIAVIRRGRTVCDAKLVGELDWLNVCGGEGLHDARLH